MGNEYIFGTVRQNGALCENLKTKSPEHTSLSGFQETVRGYPDCTIHDRFRVLEKYMADEDGEGACYDWYFIDQHYRYVDRHEPSKLIANPITLEDYRHNASERINGKCSGAIYSGITYDGKHYSLTPTAQSNLQNAAVRVDAGAETVPFAADGEMLSNYTAEQITEISSKANEWGTINVAYYAKLKEWIAAETNTAVLKTLEYGAVLPTAYMTALATQLAGFGITLSDWASALGGGDNAS